MVIKPDKKVVGTAHVNTLHMYVLIDFRPPVRVTI